MKYVIFFIIIFGFFDAISQEKIDSLLIELNKTKKDEVKIEILNKISDEAASISYDSAIYYKKQAIELAIDIDDFEKTVELKIDEGKLYLYNAEYSISLESFKSAYEFSLKTDNEKLKALCLHNIGNAYLYKTEYSNALTNYLSALEIREKIKDTAGIAATTNNIGLIYWNLSNYDEALHYYKLSLNNEILLENQIGIGSSYNNIGLIFWQTQQLDSAIFYIRKSLVIREKYGNSKQIASAYNNLGVIFRTMEVYDSSLFYFNKALILDKKNNIDLDIANVWNNIATVLSYQEKYYQAIKYADSALILSKKHDEKEMLKNAYNIKAISFKNLNNIDSAYFYLFLYSVYKDSLFDENFTNEIAEMETKYETDKKQKEIELQNLTIEKKDSEIAARKKIQTILITFIIVVLFLMVFLIRLFLQKKKSNDLLKIKNIEISQQKEEIETQANNLQDAFNEIKKINEKLSAQKEKISTQNTLLQEKNDVVESSIKYASTIQNASLPLQSDIDKFFNNWIIYYPKDIVSGDFYFFSSVFDSNKGSHNLFFIVSDCTGHGVPGAFMSLIGIRLLNKFINERNLKSPAEILNLLDDEIGVALKQSSNQNTDGMDLIICKFSDFENNDKFKLTFAGAKRDLVLYEHSSQKIQRISTTRKSIGGSRIKNKISFQNYEINLSKNDTIFLYTDGITDQNNFERKKFGTKKLFEILEQNINKSFEEQKFELEKFLALWQKDTFQRDDITFVSLKFKK